MDYLLMHFINKHAKHDCGFVDLKPVLLHPVGMRLVASWVDQEMLLYAPNARAIGGMLSGAIPIAMATSLLSIRDIVPFYIRKDASGKPSPWIEGLGNYSGSVVIVDDVSRSGRTLLLAKRRVEDARLKVDLMLSLIGPKSHSVSALLTGAGPYSCLLRE